MIAWRIKKVIKKTRKYFEANYKKHYIVIRWDKLCNNWQIGVFENNSKGLACYLGSWGTVKDNIDDAIYEAMRGSGLI